jgi:hypothetical protein
MRPLASPLARRGGGGARKQHLQGRFSGRLATKDDEKRLNTECRLLGPLLGGVGKRGDSSRLTLAKIVRGIAAGDVRKFCEERERTIKVRVCARVVRASARVRLRHQRGTDARVARGVCARCAPCARSN